MFFMSLKYSCLTIFSQLILYFGFKISILWIKSISFELHGFKIFFKSISTSLLQFVASICPKTWTLSELLLFLNKTIFSLWLYSIGTAMATILTKHFLAILFVVGSSYRWYLVRCRFYPTAIAYSRANSLPILSNIVIIPNR